MNKKEFTINKKKLDFKDSKEALLNRLGKVKTTEIYSSSSEFLVMFPNGLSINVKDTGHKKYAGVSVFDKLVDVTSKFIPIKISRKMKRKDINDLIDQLSKLNNESE